MRGLSIATIALLLAASNCGGEAPATSSSSAAASSTSPASAASDAHASAAPPPSGASAASSAAAQTGTRPLYYDRYLSGADFEGRTLRELQLMRNWIYARAGNPFRKPWLDEFFRKQDWYKPASTWDPSKVTRLDEENARLIVNYESVLTTEELEKRKDEVLARKKAGTATKEDEIELALLSQRLGTWFGEGEAPASLLSDPSRLDKLLTIEELNELSRRDLRMLRNMIYARRGWAFDSAAVKEFFKAAKWYKPAADYHEGMLNEIDHKNIAIVSSVEDSLGGPDHENPHYRKGGWDWMNGA
ncbi:MAG: YARHG domain-containing protein [Polyangiaceae bacterium]|nr:YARHG domain-containing protein [Polyangiaceae bacterium]